MVLFYSSRRKREKHINLYDIGNKPYTISVILCYNVEKYRKDDFYEKEKELLVKRRRIRACAYHGNPGSPGNARTGSVQENDRGGEVAEKRREAVRLQAGYPQQEGRAAHREIRQEQRHREGFFKEQQPEGYLREGGQLVPKKNGKATVTVKYKGTAKKLNITVGGHSWKAHKKTKIVNLPGIRCVCGKVIPLEKKDCAYCKKYTTCGKNGWCCCKQSEHTKNHILNEEPSNYYLMTVKQKVKYIDYYKCSCGAKKKGEAEPK